MSGSAIDPPASSGAPPPELPGPEQFRLVLSHFATGVAVMTSMDGDVPVGMTVQSFCSLSLDPPMILFCPGLTSTTWPRIQRRGELCVNLLADGQVEIARQFARSGTDKFQGVDWTHARYTGSPILRGGLAWIECRVASEHPGGDHVIVVCDVIALGAHVDLGALVFWQSGFKQMI